MTAPSQNSPSLTLFRGSGATGAFVWSPFVTKLETRLRFDNVAYRVGAGSPKTAPRGKIPYIELDDGRQLGDSTMIIRGLVADGSLADLKARLPPARRAHDLALRALLEDKVYFYGTREKWCDNYAAMRAGALAAVPWPVQVVVGWLARSAIARTLYGQGTGRLDDGEVAYLKEEVWESVNALLVEAQKTGGDGDEPFWVLGGEAPTEADVTLFGFVAGALVCDAAPVTNKIVRGYPAVVDYAERIYSKYFPDYEHWG